MGEITEMQFGSRVYLLPLPRPTSLCQVEAHARTLLCIGLRIRSIEQCLSHTLDVSLLPVQTVADILETWTKLTCHGAVGQPAAAQPASAHNY
jgi:hypothetical protein